MSRVTHYLLLDRPWGFVILSKRAAAAFCLLLSAFCILHSAFAADPSLSPPTTQRSTAEVLQDWDIISQQIRGVLPSPAAFADPDSRAQIAATAKPLLRKALALNTEMYYAGKDHQTEARRNHYQILAILAFLDDQPAMYELKDAKANNHKEIAWLGRRGWYLANWWRAAGDDKACNAILDELEALAKESPADDSLAAILIMFRQEGTASPQQDQRIQQIIFKDLTGPMAQSSANEFKAAEKRKSLLGKPLIVSAPTLDGKPFSTASFRGKRILVHFGATWCGPWVEQHNRLLSMDRPDDLAIVTVLSDEKPDEIKAYIERHKEIPWPVIRDSKSPAGFAALFGVESFPESILIGPDGIVLAVDFQPTERELERLQPTPAAATTAPTTSPTMK